MWWTHERRGHAANDSLETSIARQAGSQKARSPFKDSIPQLTLIVAVRIAWIFISDNNCLLPWHILACYPQLALPRSVSPAQRRLRSKRVDAQQASSPHSTKHGRPEQKRWQNANRPRARRSRVRTTNPVFFFLLFFFFLLKGKFTQNSNFTHLLLSPVSAEPLVAFHNLHNHSWVTQRERIPPRGSLLWPGSQT